jgi:hypothetical protein
MTDFSVLRSRHTGPSTSKPKSPTILQGESHRSQDLILPAALDIACQGGTDEQLSGHR